MIRVCDMIMGAGKTSAAIRMMNEDKEGKYLFITPYLDEVTWIKKTCASRTFYEPVNYGGGKMSDLKQLLKKGVNIASTHALFHNFDSEAVRLIKDAGYHLVLDEVCEVIEKEEKSEINTKNLIDLLLNNDKIVSDENGILQWNEGNYDDSLVSIKSKIECGNVYYTATGLFWTFQPEIFLAFQNVTILTFMFESSYMRCLLDLHKIEYSYIYTEPFGEGHRFTEERYVPEYVRELKSLIHISEDRKLNSIGDNRYALSVSGYKKITASCDRDKRQCKYPKEDITKQVGNNIYNYFRHKVNCKTSQCLWTIFKSQHENKSHHKKLSTNGYESGFLRCNARATNKYRERDKLAYCVNVFCNPYIKKFFESHGVVVDEDGYALSEMLQWIWRSAIRDRKEIWIYIPSSRMRGLLKTWLDEQVKQNT